MSDREIWPSNTFKVFPSSLIKVQDCSFFVMLFLKKVHIWPTKKIKYSLKGTSNERFSCQCTYLICFSIKGVTGKLMTCLYLEYKKMIISYLHCISEVQQKKKDVAHRSDPKYGPWTMDPRASVLLLIPIHIRPPSPRIRIPSHRSVTRARILEPAPSIYNTHRIIWARLGLNPGRSPSTSRKTRKEKKELQVSDIKPFSYALLFIR